MEAASPPAEAPPSAIKPEGAYNHEEVSAPQPAADPPPAEADHHSTGDAEAAPAAGGVGDAQEPDVAGNSAPGPAADPAVAEPAVGDAATAPKDEPAAEAQAAAAQQEGHAAPVKAEGTEEESAGEALDVKEPVTDEAVVERLKQLLAEVDLETTTEKQLRRKLEAEFGVDLSDRKKLLKAEINAYLEAVQAEAEEEAEEDGEEEEEEEEEEEPRSRKRKASGSSLGSYLSPEMAEFLGEERLPRTQVVKRLWEYIKANNLQDPKNKRVILFDDKLKKLFAVDKTDMFKMQKLLSKHCKTSDVVGASDEEGEDEEDDDEEEGEEEAPAPKKQRAGSSAAAKSSGKSSGSRRRSGSTEDGGAKKPNGFTKECILSDELAEWMGQPTASRPQITKHFWAYVKERGLQDPSNKGFILADEALVKLTGQQRFQAFGFNKFLKEHIKGYA